MHRGQSLDLPVHLASRGTVVEFFNEIVDERTKWNGLPIDVTAANPRKIQQVVYQLSHAFRAALDA